MTDKLTRYENALKGIASCATACGCCEMHRRVARGVLADFAANGEIESNRKPDSPLETTYPDNTCDLSPLGAALIDRSCPDCET